MNESTTATLLVVAFAWCGCTAEDVAPTGVVLESRSDGLGASGTGGPAAEIATPAPGPIQLTPQHND